MQTRWWGIVFLWVAFSFCAVVQRTTVPQQDLPYSFGEELEKIEWDGFSRTTDISNISESSSRTTLTYP